MKPISVELYNPEIITEYIDNGKIFSIKQNIRPVIDGKYWVFQDGKTFYFVNKETNVVEDK